MRDVILRRPTMATALTVPANDLLFGDHRIDAITVQVANGIDRRVPRAASEIIRARAYHRRAAIVTRIIARAVAERVFSSPQLHARGRADMLRGFSALPVGIFPFDEATYMSDKREENTEEKSTEEGRLEDLPLQPMPEEEQSKVKGGSFDLGNIVSSVVKATLPMQN